MKKLFKSFLAVQLIASGNWTILEDLRLMLEFAFDEKKKKVLETNIIPYPFRSTYITVFTVYLNIKLSIIII